MRWMHTKADGSQRPGMLILAPGCVRDCTFIISNHSYQLEALVASFGCELEWCFALSADASHC